MYLIFMSVCFVPAETLQAQAPPTAETANALKEEVGIAGFWEIELQGGRFMAQLNTITSVSQHQYIVDGAARVFEVTIDTSGSQTARFYFIEAVTDGSPLAIGKTAMDRLKTVAQGATGRTGTDDVWTQVIKNYPTTTHSRTAEFRLGSKEVLDIIYGHVHKVWAKERGRGKSNKLRINPKTK